MRAIFPAADVKTSAKNEKKDLTASTGYGTLKILPLRAVCTL